MLIVKPVLDFPEEKAVGSVAWQRRTRRLHCQGSTMAIESIEIPERSNVELQIAAIDSNSETTSPSDADDLPGPGGAEGGCPEGRRGGIRGSVGGVWRKTHIL